jgi:hypothetical protein
VNCFAQTTQPLEEDIMKFFELKKGLIAPLVVMCCLIGVRSEVAQAQTSGALLSVTGNAGTPVNFNIYDSQIHSGTVQQPPCDPNYPTDAYVLQGGSWTGQDCGDAYEVTDNNTSESAHQLPGKADISGFHIETHYICSGACSGFVSPPTFSPYCNTSGTICTTAGGPDSGFLTVTNNTGSPFTGTITLQGLEGKSPTEGDPFCPVNGVASDSVTFTPSDPPLAAGASVRLALGSQGTALVPKGADSSNCGGFNQPLGPFPMVAGTTIKFLMGDSNVPKPDLGGNGLIDELDLTPATANKGDMIQLLPVPVPAGPPTDLGLTAPIDPNGLYFGNEPLRFPPSTYTISRFSATGFPNQAIIPVESLSAPGNPVGLELDLKCTPGGDANDCDTFFWTGNQWFHVDPNSYGDNKIGGTHYLGKHLVDCPTSLFDFDAFISYTDGPLHHGNSCFAGTFTPGAPAIVGTFYTKTLVGFGFPVEDDDWNLVFKGQRIGLSFQAFDFSGVIPVTNLTLCSNSDGTGCIKPWVNIQILPITCQKGDRNVLTLFDFEFERGLENEGGGHYEYILNTPKNAPYSCFTPVFTFSSGPSIYYDGTNQTNTARFQFLQF